MAPQPPPLVLATLLPLAVQPTVPSKPKGAASSMADKPSLATYASFVGRRLLAIPRWVMALLLVAVVYMLAMLAISMHLQQGLGRVIVSTFEATSKTLSSPSMPSPPSSPDIHGSPHHAQGSADKASKGKDAHSQASVGAGLLSLIIVVSVGILGGKLAERYKQAPMLGMLVTGILLRNGLPSIIVDIPHAWTAKLWTVALSSVIARAGLAIERHTIVTNARPTCLIGTLPVLVEALCLAATASVAFGLPLAWAFTLAFGVASISPGVVVPLLLNLVERGGPEWKASRVPPIMMAAIGIDVLVATTGFGIALSAALGHPHEHRQDWMHDWWVGRALEEVVGGLCGGLVIGGGAYLLMRPRSTLVVHERLAFGAVFGVSCLAMIWGKTQGFTGAASCATILTWAIVGNTWPRHAVEAADARLKYTWNVFKPFLFPVIGACVSLSEMPLSMFFKALLLVVISVILRQFVSYAVARLARLSTDEANFLCGMWTGKASVQATLCGAALEMVHQRGMAGTKHETYARAVFCAMVSAIIVGVSFASAWASAYTGLEAPVAADMYAVAVSADSIASRMLAESEDKVAEAKSGSDTAVSIAS